MPDIDADLRFLLDTVHECPNAYAIRTCPLSNYRSLDDETREKGLAAMSEEERRQVVRHCSYCIRFYGLAQHL